MLNVAALISQRHRVFLGWWTVALAGIMHSINSSAYNKGFVIFLLSGSEGLGVSRASISLIFSLSRSEGGPVGPIAGWLIDRFGPKPVLFIGTILSGTGFILAFYRRHSRFLSRLGESWGTFFQDPALYVDDTLRIWVPLTP